MSFFQSGIHIMKIGIVIHGPEIIDSGEAKKILDKLSEIGNIRAALGGTMGKTAVLDAGLENLIDIDNSLKPSACIEFFFESQELVCLLNTGKTPKTGQIFGAMLAARLRIREKKPLLQIESPGTSEGKIIALNKKGLSYLEKFSALLGLSAEKDCSYKLEPSCKKTGEGMPENRKRIFRKVSGVFPGENILVNGIVIGKAETSEVWIVSEEGFITELEGGRIKEHGLEKLHKYEKRVPLELEKAWVKSGKIRRSQPAFENSELWRKKGVWGRTKKASHFFSNSGISNQVFGGNVAFIDHAAERCFELSRGAAFALTVGDDTTAIAGDILSRLGIPILGITDGDYDEVAAYTEVFPGSLIICLQAGQDDRFGRALKKRYFKEKPAAFFEDFSVFIKEVLELAKPLTEKVIEY